MSLQIGTPANAATTAQIKQIRSDLSVHSKDLYLNAVPVGIPGNGSIGNNGAYSRETGDITASRQRIVGESKRSYTPEQLVGRYVVVIANLAPRKMRFGISEGMVLCASSDDDRVFLLDADDGVAGGMKIS